MFPFKIEITNFVQNRKLANNEVITSADVSSAAAPADNH